MVNRVDRPSHRIKVYARFYTQARLWETLRSRSGCARLDADDRQELTRNDPEYSPSRVSALLVPVSYFLFSYPRIDKGILCNGHVVHPSRDAQLDIERGENYQMTDNPFYQLVLIVYRMILKVRYPSKCSFCSAPVAGDSSRGVPARVAATKFCADQPGRACIVFAGRVVCK